MFHVDFVMVDFTGQIVGLYEINPPFILFIVIFIEYDERLTLWDD